MATTIGKFKISLKEWFFLFIVVVLFTLILSKYFDFRLTFLENALTYVKTEAVVVANESGIMDSCPGEDFIVISRGYICGDENARDESIASFIYHSYPASDRGKSDMYTLYNRGERDKADLLLENTFDFERYEPVQFEEPLTWREDPYNERYWRFLYYSLRWERHLLTVGRETGRDIYFEKAAETIESFLDEGVDEEHAWDDNHAAAFRAMMLTNAWWKLRQHNELGRGLSEKILSSISEHAEFLTDPRHYEEGTNHAVTQAAALYLLGNNFPDLPGAGEWKELGRERLDLGLASIIGLDGVIVENAPYYHFYTLEKYWEIYRYTNEQDLTISDDFNEKIARMVEYSTHILNPRNDMPLLGASIPRTITKSGEFREIANQNERFDYVLTQGKRGAAPPRQNVFFNSAGQMIMRSGWGQKVPYTDEAHLVFDMGPYRTDHSDLDALTFSLYGKGGRIIRDTGLYTYETDNKFYNYFHGTRGHNTVVVDGLNQSRGEPEVGASGEGEGYVFQSALHNLYPGVEHKRGVLLIEGSAVVVVDELNSLTTHLYEQMFHLPPETVVTQRDKIIKAQIPGVNEDVYIVELGEMPTSLNQEMGNTEDVRGLCAVAYEELQPCPEIVYSSQARNARFVTLIYFGQSELSYVMNKENDRISAVKIETESGTYDVAITHVENHIGFEVDSTSKEKGFLEKLFNFFGVEKSEFTLSF